MVISVFFPSGARYFSPFFFPLARGPGSNTRSRFSRSSAFLKASFFLEVTTPFLGPLLTSGVTATSLPLRTPFLRSSAAVSGTADGAAVRSGGRVAAGRADAGLSDGRAWAGRSVVRSTGTRAGGRCISRRSGCLSLGAAPGISTLPRITARLAVARGGSACTGGGATGTGGAGGTSFTSSTGAAFSSGIAAGFSSSAGAGADSCAAAGTAS